MEGSMKMMRYGYSGYYGGSITEEQEQLERELKRLKAWADYYQALADVEFWQKVYESRRGR